MRTMDLYRNFIERVRNNPLPTPEPEALTGEILEAVERCGAPVRHHSTAIYTAAKAGLAAAIAAVCILTAVTATDGPDRHYTEISALAQAPEKEKSSTDRKNAYLDNYRKHRKRTAMYQEIIARSTNTYDHENR